jgi:hypothetical protein
MLCLVLQHAQIEMYIYIAMRRLNRVAVNGQSTDESALVDILIEILSGTHLIYMLL